MVSPSQLFLNPSQLAPNPSQLAASPAQPAPRPSTEPLPDHYQTNSSLKLNKAVYTAPLVACWWAGAVKWQKKPKKQTDHGPTDRRTDGPT